MKEKREDLRVVKTRRAIRAAITDMICELDYEQISIKELCSRAMLNRKTFYLHYKSLGDLLQELQDEIADIFISKAISYRSLSDIKAIIRVFFETAASMSALHERLLCNYSYQHIGEQIIKKVMAHRYQVNKGAFGLNAEKENLVFAYFTINSGNLFRQWVADGKKLPLEDLIDIAIKLICHGMASVIPAEQ